MNKWAINLLAPWTWQQLMDRNFHLTRCYFNQAARYAMEIKRYKNKRRACHLETFRDFKSMDLVISIPDSFPLCPRHLAIHKQKHDKIINPTACAAKMTDRSHWGFRSGWYPMSHFNNLETESNWACLEKAKEWAEELSKHVHWKISWETFEFKRDMTINEASRPSVCSWARLQFFWLSRRPLIMGNCIRSVEHGS